MFKYFNYKPKFLQITDNDCDFHSYSDVSGGTDTNISSNINTQPNQTHTDDANGNYPNADNQNNINNATPMQSDANIQPQWQASPDGNSGSPTTSSPVNSVDNVSDDPSLATLASNTLPSISPKARKYMQYSQLHEQKLKEILEQLNEKDN